MPDVRSTTMNHHLTVIATIAAPIVLGWLARTLRCPRGVLGDLARVLRDLITLRMVLRDTEPTERADLLKAHRVWRTERAGQVQRLQASARTRTRADS
jgi:hypothetical protein